MQAHWPAKLLGWILILTSLGAAVPILKQRTAVESAYNQVEIAVDYAAVLSRSEAAAAQDQVLGTLAAAGATAAIVDVFTGKGLDAELLTDLDTAGLRPLPRVHLPPDADSLAQMLLELPPATAGVAGVIFKGTALPPDPAIPSNARSSQIALALNRQEYMLYIEEDPRRPDAVAITGLDWLAAASGYRAARAYTTGPLANAPDSPEAAAARAVLAVRDRNVRVLLVNPFPSPAADVAAETAAQVTQLVKLLQQNGFDRGTVLPMEYLAVTPGRAGLVGLGAAGALLLYLSVFAAIWRVPNRYWYALGGLAVLATLGLNYMGATGTVIALACAIFYPAAAAALIWQNLQSGLAAPLKGLRLAGAGLIALSTMFLLNLAGGAAVAALLASPRYMLQIEAFRGVRLALLLPPLLAAAAILIPIGNGPARIAAARPGRGRQIHHSLRQPGVWLGIGITLTIIFWYIERAGNNPFGGVPEWERRLRHTLDFWLGARPRFKEFVVGYPALGIATAAAAAGRRRWPAIGFVIGSIAGTSIMNTFAHAHTPFAVSLLRTFNGFWLGGLLAAVGGLCTFILIGQPPDPPRFNRCS